jgi:hypothetical protein
MSLLSAGVKDFVTKKDRKIEETPGAGGAAGNAGAFILSDAIKSQKETLETNQGNKADEKNWMPVPKGFFDFISRPHFYNFLESLLEYCRELFRLENK